MKNAIPFLLMLASMQLIQCKKHDNSQTYIPVTYPPVTTSKNYLALGDSYTIGQSVDSAQRFPSQTVSLLRAMGISINSPDFIAVTGWTTDDLANGIASHYPSKQYDVVSLLIGVNDQYQRHDTTGYRARFLGLLNTAINLAGGSHQRVVVVSIPDYSVTPFASMSDTARIRREIDWFNDINRSVTEEQYCQYLYMTDFTREARYDSTLIAGDGLHPSGKEYQKWAEPLSQMMYPLLR